MFMVKPKLFIRSSRLYGSFSSLRVKEVSPAKVTLLDASSSVGLNLALLLKQNPLVSELSLYDATKDTFDIASDLDQIDTSTAVKPFGCDRLKDAIMGAHVVVSTGGCPDKPGESQKELFDKNMDNVRNAAIFLSEFNPTAIYCIAKPAVEALVPMAAEEYKQAECYDPGKIIGVTTAAAMVANTLIAKYLKADPTKVLCPIVGGLSPQTTIPVISQTKPSVDYNPKVYADLQNIIANAEEDLLKKGSMLCYTKSVAVARFVNLILKAIGGAENCVECAFVAQTGHIQNFLPYMASIIKLGPEGVLSTHMPKLNDFEITLLKVAMPHILKNIILGQTFLHGDFSLYLNFQNRGRCDGALKERVKAFDQRLRPIPNNCATK